MALVHTPLNELTKPFQVVNASKWFVKDKFLEGVPYKNQNFPGPFKGLGPVGNNEYMNLQQNAVTEYPLIAEYPLNKQANMYPLFNAGLPNCDSYGGPSPMTPPVQSIDSYLPNGELSRSEQMIKRGTTMPDYPYEAGSFNRMGSHVQPGGIMSVGGGNQPGPLKFENMNGNLPPGMQDAIFDSNYNPDSNGGGNNPTKIETFSGVNNFHDDSITNPCNQTGFGEIVPKFVELPDGVNAWSPNSGTGFMKCSEEGNPLTDIKNRPVDQFSHNNMVPQYGSKLTQNMAATDVAQAGDNNSRKGLVNGFADVTPFRDKLQTFTGCDEMYMHKRETGPMYSPVEQATGWVFGSPAIRPDLDRYKDSIWRRNNETPVEKQNVGPGIGLDYSVPAQGGFQQYTRILPNNVNDYKSNQLEGRVAGGKWQISDHPTSQYVAGVDKNKPDLTITQARRPTMKTKFYNNSPEAGDSRITDFTIQANRGRQNRSDTEPGAGFGQFDMSKYIYQGSSNGGSVNEGFTNFNDPNGLPCVEFAAGNVGMVMGSKVPMPTQDLSSYNTIRETFKRGAAGYNEETGYWECDERTQGQDRWDLFGPARGSVPSETPRDGWYVNYTDRGDTNPFVINVTGTNFGGVWSPNNYEDQQRVTTKETTLYSNPGNPVGQEKMYENTWSDLPKNTTKETTQYSYVANPNGQQKMYENTWSDSQKTTRKETTSYAHAGNAAQGGTIPTDRFMYDGGDYFPVK